MKSKPIIFESIFNERLIHRAAVNHALSDMHRLAITDLLACSDRSPSELADRLNIDSNLLAHHLSVLARVNLIERVSSQGDGRRRYVRLVHSALSSLDPHLPFKVERVVFVCTENVARSRLAAALWNEIGLEVTATSGGTHPGRSVHPGAIRAAMRRGLDLRGGKPQPVPKFTETDLVVTVCDRAHEHLLSATEVKRVHWSVPDPVGAKSPNAFETTTEFLAERIEQLATFI